MIEKFISNELSLKRYRRFKKDRMAMVSLGVLAILFFFSLTAELWANSKPIVMKYHGKFYAPIFFDYHPSEFDRTDIYVMDYRALKLSDGDWIAWPLVQWDPYESNKDVDTYPSKPTHANIFGTDDRGRDVFTRLLYGFRYSMAFAIGSWLLTYTLGTIIGSVMGYVGGKFDLFGMRVVEILESTPTTLLLITLISIFSPGLVLLMSFNLVFGWMTIAQYMRGQFLSIRNREYVDAARALGASHWRVISKHILPNALTPIVTFSPFTIAGNINTLAVLDYLGLGLKAPTPSWGELMGQSLKYFSIAEWLVWYPSGALLLTMVCMINIGLAVRDAFDSRAI